MAGLGHSAVGRPGGRESESGAARAHRRHLRGIGERALEAGKRGFHRGKAPLVARLRRSQYALAVTPAPDALILLERESTAGSMLMLVLLMVNVPAVMRLPNPAAFRLAVVLAA